MFLCSRWVGAKRDLRSKRHRMILYEVLNCWCFLRICTQFSIYFAFCISSRRSLKLLLMDDDDKRENTNYPSSFHLERSNKRKMYRKTHAFRVGKFNRFECSTLHSGCATMLKWIRIGTKMWFDTDNQVGRTNYVETDIHLNLTSNDEKQPE